jgi:adenylate cyclase
VARFVAEAAEHRRIRKRFQSYVDPSLVQYVYEHPELIRMEGEVREMTVCFTDLVGFTSLTEEFKERAVPLLGRYTSKMVPIIRRHRGLVICFMGDGLMFSYGAPQQNSNHAVDAVTTILEMFPAIEEFNRELVAEGYPELAVRAGVSTGEVVVGDTGGDDACDYTCLGDVTNFGARLESANKALGTTALISARTVELLGGKFLVRFIACLRVSGKKKGNRVYEPLSLAESATPRQHKSAEMTNEMADHFIGARFQECIFAAGALDRQFGPSKLTKLYREACNHHLNKPDAEFTGQIVLDQK